MLVGAFLCRVSPLDGFAESVGFFGFPAGVAVVFGLVVVFLFSFVEGFPDEFDFELLLELPLSPESELSEDLLAITSRDVEAFFLGVDLFDAFLGLSEMRSSISSMASSSSAFFLMSAGASLPSGFGWATMTEIIKPDLAVEPARGLCSRIVFGGSSL